MTVPYTFGTATSSIPLSQLDSNFNTPITLGNTAVYLGNTTTTLNALTLSNVTITSGNVTITGVTVANVNVTSTLTLSGLTASTALALDASKNVVSVTNTGSGNNVLATSPTLTTPNLGTPSALTLTNATGLPLSTGVTGTLPTSNGGTGLTSFTANGILYASSTSALATGSALTFDGSSLAVAGFIRSSNYTPVPSTGVGGEFYYVPAQTTTYLNSYDRAGGTYKTLALSGSEISFQPSGSEQMRLTSTGLGIGTSSPAYKLDVRGSSQNGIYYKTSGTYSAIVSDNSSTTGGGAFSAFVNGTQKAVFTTSGWVKGDTSVDAAIFADVNSGIQFFTNNSSTAKAIIDSSGNLGLGVTPSAWSTSYVKAFDVNTTGAIGSYSNGTASQQMWVVNNAYLNSSFNWIYKYTGVGAFLYTQDVGHNWKIAPSGTAGNAITFTQAMTLDANGNLLIGTTSAGATANAVWMSPSTSTIRFDNTPASGKEWSVGTSSPGVSTAGDYLSFARYSGSAWAEYARIDSSGNFLVGTTSATAGAVTVRTHIAGSEFGLGISVPASGAQQNIRFVNGTTAVGSVTTSASSTTYNTTSDYRLKNVIGAVSDAGSRIDALEPIEYEWKVNGKRTRGFLAHKFQEVYADSVTGEKDAVDAEGKPVYQAMQASSPEVIADLVAEIQSLRKRLAAAGIA